MRPTDADRSRGALMGSFGFGDVCCHMRRRAKGKHEPGLAGVGRRS